VKAYKPGHLVTADEVRALVALHADQRANKEIVTTTSDFAPRIIDDPFIKPFLPTRIELVNGKQLLEQLKALPDSPGNW
jgi:restriction system protein